MGSSKVSIIIPLYNSRKYCEVLSQSLLGINYPVSSFEIIFVDNGSTDRSIDALRNSFKDKPHNVKFLEETETQSSYAARNRGIYHAQGEILAFTDSDCRPHPDWLNEGVKAIYEANADLAGGKVEFYFRKNDPDAAEYIDATSNMQIEKNILEEGKGKTANLFVRKYAFDKIGLFNREISSGGDVEWTRRGVKEGLILVYAKDAVVYHPARNYIRLILKQIRVGGGQMASLKLEKGSWFKRIKFIVKLPKNGNSNSRVSQNPFVSFRKPGWLAFRFVRFSMKISLRFGRFLAFFRIKIPASW